MLTTLGGQLDPKLDGIAWGSTLWEPSVANIFLEELAGFPVVLLIEVKAIVSTVVSDCVVGGVRALSLLQHIVSLACMNPPNSLHGN